MAFPSALNGAKIFGQNVELKSLKICSKVGLLTSDILNVPHPINDRTKRRDKIYIQCFVIESFTVWAGKHSAINKLSLICIFLHFKSKHNLFISFEMIYSIY